MDDIKVVKPHKPLNKTLNPEIKLDRKSLESFVAKISKSNKGLIYSFIVLFLAGSLCAGLWWYENSLIQESEVLSGEINALEGQRDLALEKEFAVLKTKIDGLKTILKNRVYGSLVFELLEELTLPKVRLTSMNLDLSKAELGIGVESVDYATLGQQIFAFENDARVKKVTSNEMNLDNSGRVGSDFLIELDVNFLRSKKY